MIPDLIVYLIWGAVWFLAGYLVGRMTRGVNRGR